jgi:hypothetical protein
VREEQELLEDHADLPAQGGKIVQDLAAAEKDLLAEDRHVGGVGHLEQVEAAQEGTLAAAALAHERDDAAGADVEVDALEHRAAVVGLLQAADRDGCFPGVGGLRGFGGGCSDGLVESHHAVTFWAGE